MRGVTHIQFEKVHCLFEQSGTFKKQFQKLGYDAKDYDIKNDFAETDCVIDLFSEIDKAYDKKPSIFDSIGMNDLVVAFFPCTRFEDNIILYFTGKASSISKWSSIKKIEYAMKLHEELHRLYMLVCKLFILAYRGGGN